MLLIRPRNNRKAALVGIGLVRGSLSFDQRHFDPGSALPFISRSHGTAADNRLVRQYCTDRRSVRACRYTLRYEACPGDLAQVDWLARTTYLIPAPGSTAPCSGRSD